jgi:hypothetical protein
VVLSAALIAIGLAAPLPAWDRARLATALEQLIATGEPRHVNHDEGEELQAALTAALANPDPDLKALATRASIPIVAQVARPLFSPDDPGSLRVRSSRVLILPWSVSYTATLEARVNVNATNPSPWRRIARLTSGQDMTERLDRVLPRAWLSAGFHDVELRARLEYDALPEGLPREELRTLPAIHYGVSTGTNAARAVTRLVDRGRYASVAQLDAALPDVPLAIWLMQFPPDHPGVDVYWRTEWCSLATHPSGEGQPLNDVCSVATFQPPQGAVAEVWVKIADLVVDTDGAHWTEAGPNLEAAFLRRSGRAPIRLAMLPVLLGAAEQHWPAPQLVVRSADITTTPPAPRPAQPGTLSAVVTNYGTGDAFGVTIDLIVGSAADGSGQPIIHRRFVRDIPAGGQVELTANVSYPAGYGWIMVHAMVLTEHAEWPIIDSESPIAQPIAIHVVNAPAAPPGYAAAICRHAAGPASCGAQ